VVTPMKAVEEVVSLQGPIEEPLQGNNNPEIRMSLQGWDTPDVRTSEVRSH
jgi:hypothetical protein